jgi:hypothetical protein
MKYIKTYNNINENKGNEDLSFEDFKEIMYDLYDILGDDDYKFYNHGQEKRKMGILSKSRYLPIYECQIQLPKIKEVLIDEDTYYYLTEFEEHFKNVEDYKKSDIDIDKKIEELKKGIEYLNKKILINEEKIKPFFKTFEEVILPRLISFKNFENCRLVFSYYTDNEYHTGDVNIILN